MNEKRAADRGLVSASTPHELSPSGSARRGALRTLAGGSALMLASGGLLGTTQAFGQSTENATKRGGRIRVATQSISTADTADPAKAAISTDYVRLSMCYNGLTELDSHLGAQLALAESIETSDAKFWVVRLRKGVQFHDGKELVSDDVVYSLARHKLPEIGSKAKTLADQIADVKAAGRYQIEITLSGPNADLPVILATSHFAIVKAGTANFATPIGTGPFKIKEFIPGVKTVGVRNERYWRTGRPYLDEIELVGIGDDATRVNALLAGDVQLISGLTPLLSRRVKNTPGYEVLETKTGQYTDLIARDQGGITGNQDFRTGMKYLLDREQINKSIVLGYGTVGNDQPIDPTNKYFYSGLPQRQFDIDKAAFFFRKANLGNAPVELFASPTADYSVEMSVLLQQAAPRAGLNLKISRVPSDGYWSNYWMKRPLTFGNINARPSADILLAQFFTSDAPWNEANVRDPKLDQLIVAARGEHDEKKRKQMYGDIQVLISQQGGVCIPLFLSSLDGHSNKLKGLGVVPIGGLMGFSFPEHVWLDT